MRKISILLFCLVLSFITGFAHQVDKKPAPVPNTETGTPALLTGTSDTGTEIPAEPVAISPEETDARYKKTMSDLEFLRSAILDFVMEEERAPKAKNIAELLDTDLGNGLTFSELYLDDMPREKIPVKDAWGNDFVYKYKNRKKDFMLGSSGSDGEFKGFKQRGTYFFASARSAGNNNSACPMEGKDIIISNDGFVFLPIDKQQYYFLWLFYKNHRRFLDFWLMMWI